MVDPKSYELAEYFLADFGKVPKKLTMQLAEYIQEAVEDWLGWAEDKGLIEETAQ